MTQLPKISCKKPTAEQIKNLHDLFCIDVEILDEREDK